MCAAEAASVTLDELCNEVEVSKRTFFRNFASKEDVAMAPTQDLWLAFLDELGTVEPDDRPLVDLMLETLLSALDRVAADDWAHRILASSRLAEQTPTMDAHGPKFCENTTHAALEILRGRFDLGGPGDLRPRLAMDMLVSAFHCALSGWVALADSADRADVQELPNTQELATLVRSAVAALPGSLTLTVAPRRTDN